MKTVYKLFFMLLVSNLPLGLISASNFKSGFVVTAKGDTLNGFIDNENWGINPNVIRFCHSLNDSVVSFVPKDLRLFKVEGDVFVSSEVEVEISPRQFGWLSLGPALQLERKTIFLRTLVSGPKSLLYYKESESNECFYIKIDSTYQLLAFKKYFAYPNNTSVIRSLKRYIGQLTLYMNDQPELSDLINKAEYNKNSLIDLFDAYYKKSGSAHNPPVKREKITVNFGLNAALTMNRLHFTGSEFPELMHGVKPQGLTFTPAIYIELVEPRNRGRWSFYSDLLYTDYQFESQYDDGLWFYDTKMEFGYVKMHHLLRYKFPMENGSWFVNAGGSTGYLIHQVNTQQRIHKSHSDWSEYGNALDNVLKLELGLVFGVGVNYKHLSLEYRIISGGGMSSYATLNSETRSNNLLLSYRF